MEIKKIKEKNVGKRGELTTKQLVTIIVLVVSFIVILFLLFRLNLGETSNKEVCHNSIVLRGQAGVVAGPLDCRTNYLCISGGGNCEEITPTATVNVDSRNKEEIMEALADEMADCWWMFGEGEVRYVDRNAFNDVACSICSIVEFDEKIKEEIGIIEYRDFYDYLRTTAKSDTQTYLQYLYAENSLERIEEGFNQTFDGYLDETFNPEQDYFILTGMSKGYFFVHWQSEYVPVVIMEREAENYEKIGCDTFLTKS